MERRSGKTTRLVDKVIQHLFEKGTLYLIRNEGMNSRLPEIPDEELIFIDPDQRNGNRAQNDFVRRVLNRLSAEHSGSIEVVKKSSYFKITEKKLPAGAWPVDPKIIDEFGNLKK